MAPGNESTALSPERRNKRQARATPKMSLPVFAKHQNPGQDQPPHYIGKQLALLVIAARFARPLDKTQLKRGIQLTTVISWKMIKASLRPPAPGLPIVTHHLNPPTYHTMNFQNYPEPDRVTVYTNHRAFLASMPKPKPRLAQEESTVGV